MNTTETSTQNVENLSFAQVVVKDTKKVEIITTKPETDTNPKENVGAENESGNPSSEAGNQIADAQQDNGDSMANSVSMLSLESQSTMNSTSTAETNENEDGSELEFGLDGCNIFVGDLAKGITEEQIETAFAACGKVASVSIKRDKHTGKNLGYGFVRMSTKEEALLAKKTLHQTEIHGRKVRLGWAQKNTSLFVGGLDESVTLQKFLEAFQMYGPVEEENCFVRGKFGFVKFKYRIHAEQARKEMNGCCFWNAPLKVEWNNANNNQNRACTLHIRLEGDENCSLPDGALNSIFENYPEVFGFSNLKEKTWSMDGQHYKKVYGFVYFLKNRDGERAAARAVESLQGTLFHGFTIECSLTTPSKRYNNGGNSRKNTSSYGGSNTQEVSPRQYAYMPQLPQMWQPQTAYMPLAGAYQAAALAAAASTFSTSQASDVDASAEAGDYASQAVYNPYYQQPYTYPQIYTNPYQQVYYGQMDMTSGIDSTQYAVSPGYQEAYQQMHYSSVAAPQQSVMIPPSSISATPPMSESPQKGGRSVPPRFMSQVSSSSYGASSNNSELA